MPCKLENILLIANPASQNGNGARLAERAMEMLFRKMADASIDVVLTRYPHHAAELAATSSGFDTLITLGGDGVVHEAVNGLMQLASEERPRLGVIPTGSGNDFARALGMPQGMKRACEALCRSSETPIDVGRVNGSFSIETLSFGLDAAIAHDTVERRRKTGRKGALLYGESAIHQLKHSFRAYSYTMRADDGAPESGECITFAVQNGPFYGGGFKICPDARLDDGAFDICISHAPVSRARASFAFLRAKGGKHLGMPEFTLEHAQRIVVDFDEEPPAQMDGEALTGTHFEVDLLHDAIRALTPAPPSH